ncbi:MAG: YidB family protein [Rhizobiales bacterium]|nr:YidB family protein [Hyphomicrobiales bacterium]
MSSSALSKIAIAALGILAYKNRDKIGGMLGDLGDSLGVTPGSSGSSTGGLGDLLDSFKNAGHGEAADSWVGTGPNKAIAPEHVEKAISPEVLDQLAQQTGMSRSEILDRLSKDIPDAVNEMTPDGKLPPEPAGKGPWAA